MRRKKIAEHEFVPARRRVLQTLALASGAVVAGFAAPWRLMADAAETQGAVTGTPAPAFRVGEFNKIYDPSVGETERWYINDHTFIRAEDGQWHLFGITHREPANAQQEKFLVHATAPDLMGPWKKQAPVLHVPAFHNDEKQNETVVWAPYVLRHGGLYWMYYCAGGRDHARYRIHLATSADLWSWKRHPANPMVVDGYDARDPMVVRFDDQSLGDQWLLYYCATSTPEGGKHTVKVVSSRDLSHWANPQEVFRDAEAGTYGGPTESPFVVARDGKYYLFVCTNHSYNETVVYESEMPFHWDAAKLVGKFPAHAAEVIHTPEGKWFVSRAGWGQGGVFLAELTWES